MLQFIPAARDGVANIRHENIRIFARANQPFQTAIDRGSLPPLAEMRRASEVFAQGFRHAAPARWIPGEWNDGPTSRASRRNLTHLRHSTFIMPVTTASRAAARVARSPKHLTFPEPQLDAQSPRCPFKNKSIYIAG